MSRAARLRMIDMKHPELPIVKQCVLLNVARSTVYYRPASESAENLTIMGLMDEQYLRTPYYGARKFVEWLLRQGQVVNRKRVKRLMRLMGIEAIYQKPNTSKKHPENKIYPYLLRGLTIDRVNQVWCTDITYIRMPKGFLYLVVVMDWVSRKALSWRLSNTMDADFCVEALEEAVARYGRPEIFNTDQGSQFTSTDFTGVLLREGIAISMDGKGRFMDNIFIERLWRSLKYEEVFIKSYATAMEARSGVGNYILHYNSERIHQALDYYTPDEVFNAGASLWTPYLNVNQKVRAHSSFSHRPIRHWRANERLCLSRSPGYFSKVMMTFSSFLCYNAVTVQGGNPMTVKEMAGGTTVPSV